jgi:polyvinyl alcohol dehydrogenase (cytochrome)
LSADSSGTDWVVYGHDLSNTRLNPSETQINPASVGSLTERWEKDGLVGVTGTPVVSGGVAYFGDETGTIWAVSADTGQQIWTAKVGGLVVGSPAIDGDRVYVGVGNSLYALDRATGMVRWKAETNPSPYAQINASPVVVGGLVVQGTAQFEEVVGKAPFTFRGSIGAFDGPTGAQVWNFITTPNDATSGAGEGIWSTPAVDAKLGLLYVGTGQNTSPPTGRLADSLLAIDYKTGTLRWSTQFTNPDVFGVGNYTGKDADVGASPNLWTSDGRDVVGVGQKNGVYHALDAATGKELWNTALTPGSTFGGVLGSSAFVDGKIIASSNVGDPDTNATTNMSKIFALDPRSGKILWALAEKGNVFGPISAVRGVAFVGTDAGVLAAVDTSTGTTFWTYAAPAQTGGGASIVSGNVLWGYGFTLFKGPGKGGIISFKVNASAPSNNGGG